MRKAYTYNIQLQRTQQTAHSAYSVCHVVNISGTAESGYSCIETNTMSQARRPFTLENLSFHNNNSASLSFSFNGSTTAGLLDEYWLSFVQILLLFIGYLIMSLFDPYYTASISMSVRSVSMVTGVRNTRYMKYLVKNKMLVFVPFRKIATSLGLVFTDMLFFFTPIAASPCYTLSRRPVLALSNNIQGS